MSVEVRIPTTFRPLSGGVNKVTVEGSTIAEVIAALDSAHPGFAARLLDESGNIPRHVNVFLADDDVRYMDGPNTPVPDGAEVSIIPAVAGG